MNLELNEDQKRVLKELLELDMDRIGFDSDDIDLLDEIYDKLE